MNDIMKIVQALEDSNILLKGVTKTIKNETKEQKGGFLSMLYIINLDEYADVGTHWIVFFCKTKWNWIYEMKWNKMLNIFLKKLNDLLEIKT